MLRESSGFLFGKYPAPVDLNLENTAFGFDQLGLYAESIFESVRQTGGSGTVVSNDAKLY